MENKSEVVNSFYIGQKNSVNILIYGKNIDTEEPSFSFEIKFIKGGNISWNNYSENYGGFEYDSEKDAIDAALDFLIDHATFYTIDEKNMKKVFYNAYLNEEIDDMNENPEDNIEEVPEDFRLNMKK